MHEPIDIDTFIAQLADNDAFSDALWGLMKIEDPVVNFIDELSDDQYTAEILDDWSTPAQETPAEARERTIDALIEAATGTPATAIRETLGAVLDDFLLNVHRIDIEKLERRLDGDL